MKLHPVLRLAVLWLLIPAVLRPMDAPAQALNAGLAQNAALHYIKAAALLDTPRTELELQTQDFINNELPLLPPSVLAAHPEALRALLRDRSSLMALNNGARQTLCVFPVQTDSAALDLTHLPPLRSLAYRALMLAKAYEYVDNPQGAAGVYIDIFRLVEHLDQDRNVTSGLLAGDLIQLTLSELEGFLSREHPADALALLTRYFDNSPKRVLRLPAYLRDEAKRNSDWLLQHNGRPEDRIARLYGNAKSKPAVDKLITLDKARKEQRLQEWVEEYQRRMEAMALASEQPFADGIKKMARMDAERATMEKDRSGGKNPLIPLLMPQGVDLYQLFLLAEAQYDAATIMVYAAAARAENKKWPDNIDEINLFAHHPMPTDVFSGKDFYYRIDRGSPELIIRIPKKMSLQPEYLYNVNVARRQRNDGARGAEAIQRLQEERKRNPRLPVPMEP